MFLTILPDTLSDLPAFSFLLFDPETIQLRLHGSAQRAGVAVEKFDPLPLLGVALPACTMWLL